MITRHEEKMRMPFVARYPKVINAKFTIELKTELDRLPGKCQDKA